MGDIVPPTPVYLIHNDQPGSTPVVDFEGVAEKAATTVANRIKDEKLLTDVARLDERVGQIATERLVESLYRHPVAAAAPNRSGGSPFRSTVVGLAAVAIIGVAGYTYYDKQSTEKATNQEQGENAQTPTGALGEMYNTTGGAVLLANGSRVEKDSTIIEGCHPMPIQGPDGVYDVTTGTRICWRLDTSKLRREETLSVNGVPTPLIQAEVIVFNDELPADVVALVVSSSTDNERAALASLIGEIKEPTLFRFMRPDDNETPIIETIVMPNRGKK